MNVAATLKELKDPTIQAEPVVFWLCLAIFMVTLCWYILGWKLRAINKKLKTSVVKI
jgi:hypothetical protein